MTAAIKEGRIMSNYDGPVGVSVELQHVDGVSYFGVVLASDEKSVTIRNSYTKAGDWRNRHVRNLTVPWSKISFLSEDIVDV